MLSHDTPYRVRMATEEAVWEIQDIAAVGRGLLEGRTRRFRFLHRANTGTYGAVWIVNVLPPSCTDGSGAVTEYGETGLEGRSLVLRIASTALTTFDASVGAHMVLQTWAMDAHRADGFLRIYDIFETGVDPPASVLRHMPQNLFPAAMSVVERPYGCILMEVANAGTLHDRLSLARHHDMPFTPREAMATALSLVWNLAAFQQLRLRHGDLHAANIMFVSQEDVDQRREYQLIDSREHSTTHMNATLDLQVQKFPPGEMQWKRVRMVLADFDLTRSYMRGHERDGEDATVEETARALCILPRPKWDEGPPTLVPELFGPLYTRAPELLALPRISFADLPLYLRPSAHTDVWSAGVLLLQMLTGAKLAQECISRKESDNKRVVHVALDTWYALHRSFNVHNPPSLLVTKGNEYLNATAPPPMVFVDGKDAQVVQAYLRGPFHFKGPFMADWRDDAGSETGYVRRAEPLTITTLFGYKNLGTEHTDTWARDVLEEDERAALPGRTVVLMNRGFETLLALCYMVDAIGLPPLMSQQNEQNYVRVQAPLWLLRIQDSVKHETRQWYRPNNGPGNHPQFTTVSVGVYPMFLDSVRVWSEFGMVYRVYSGKEHMVDESTKNMGLTAESLRDREVAGSPPAYRPSLVTHITADDLELYAVVHSQEMRAEAGVNVPRYGDWPHTYMRRGSLSRSGLNFKLLRNNTRFLLENTVFGLNWLGTHDMPLSPLLMDPYRREAVRLPRVGQSALEDLDAFYEAVARSQRGMNAQHLMGLPSTGQAGIGSIHAAATAAMSLMEMTLRWNWNIYGQRSSNSRARPMDLLKTIKLVYVDGGMGSTRFMQYPNPAPGRNPVSRVILIQNTAGDWGEDRVWSPGSDGAFMVTSQQDPKNGGGGRGIEVDETGNYVVQVPMYSYQRDIRLFGMAVRSGYGGGNWAHPFMAMHAAKGGHKALNLRILNRNGTLAVLETR